jgi:LPXTG-site transpeptidase (sortase) family protein
LPTIGAVAPITDMRDKADKQKYLDGQIDMVDLNAYLKRGVLHYPGTVSYGEKGNAVILGHSSYAKDDNGSYKTVFQAIIGLATGDPIWIYQKKADGTYTQYEYIVKKSYETTPRNVNVLDTTCEKVLTLITCTPIGGTSGRWVVEAKYSGETMGY